MDEERLAVMEQENRRLNRRLQVLTLGLFLVAVLAAVPLVKSWMHIPSDAKEVRTERLVIVDQTGNPIGTFGQDENGGFIRVAGGDSLVTIFAGKAGSIVAQHGNQLCYMSADRDVALFKVSNPQVEAALKSTASTEECAFWVASNSKGRVYLGLNNDYGASGFLRSDAGQNVWDISEKKPTR